MSRLIKAFAQALVCGGVGTISSAQRPGPSRPGGGKRCYAG